jgi:CheY-like chemotaxis protein
MKLILLTPEGLGSGEAKMKLLRWFHGYLGKPVKRRALLAEVFRVLTAEHEPELAELEPAGELEEVSPEPTERGTGARILVAEDHEVNRQLFKTILEKLGHQVVLARDGLEAVEAAGGGRYDLIFMDIQMPNLNGYDATRKLREMGVRTPIIAVTASALQTEQKRALEAGMDHCLTKPFKKKDLVPILDQWLPADPHATGDGEEQVFDFAGAVDAFLGREDVLRSVLASFLQTTEEQIARFLSALEDGDWETVRREAHSIKGGAWNLSAQALGEAARLLEETAAAGKTDSSAEALAGLQGEFERFKRAAAPYSSNVTPTGQ